MLSVGCYFYVLNFLASNAISQLWESNLPEMYFNSLNKDNCSLDAQNISQTHIDLCLSDVNASVVPLELEFKDGRNYIQNLPPANFSSLLGSTRYYAERAKDFSNRNLNMRIPYYLEYGEKYQNRFKELRTTVRNDQTIAWIDNTHYALQKAIEDKRQENPRLFAELERNFDEFRNFCFRTHATAYVQSGFCNLPMNDIITIIRTPDTSDLISIEGVLQGFEVADQCSSVWIDRLTTYFSVVFSSD